MPLASPSTSALKPPVQANFKDRLYLLITAVICAALALLFWRYTGSYGFCILVTISFMGDIVRLKNRLQLVSKPAQVLSDGSHDATPEKVFTLDIEGATAYLSAASLQPFENINQDIGFGTAWRISRKLGRGTPQSTQSGQHASSQAPAPTHYCKVVASNANTYLCLFTGSATPPEKSVFVLEAVFLIHAMRRVQRRA